MRYLDKNELLAVNAGSALLPIAILGTGVLGGVTGAYIGYSQGESYTKDSNAWIQVNVIGTGITVGGLLGFQLGFFSAATATAFLYSMVR